MVGITKIEAAHHQRDGVIPVTPLVYNETLSNLTKGSVWLKREDTQVVRSYKIRGAYNLMSGLSEVEKAAGVVCASAGNHAQGVAFACALMQVKGVIFMPETTPKQKIAAVKRFGQSWVEIRLAGDTFDAAFLAAKAYEHETNCCFVHPFDDERIIAGQATVGLEIAQQSETIPDIILVPIGGGGLAAGVISYYKQLYPETKIIGVEPEGAPSMKQSIENGIVTRLEQIDKFVDGAAVQQVGNTTFSICQQGLDDVLTVPEGKVCATILRLYNEEALVVEPAGALTIAAAELYAEQLHGKSLVCVVSGSNNDIFRMPEIQERALLYLGKKHYFLIEFPQRPGALKAFVSDVLQAEDDITHFQFSQKNNRESGPAVVGIELPNADKLNGLKERLHQHGFYFEYLNDNFTLFNQLIG
jgi:threonine dehydratase